MFQHAAATNHRRYYRCNTMYHHPAALRRLGRIRYRNYDCVVSTRSRPKAAELTEEELQSAPLFQHAAARRRLIVIETCLHPLVGFQHAAARRRLGKIITACRGT